MSCSGSWTPPSRPRQEDRNIAALLAKIAPNTPRILALNKVDLVPPDSDFSEHLDLCEHERALPTGAREKRGIADLIDCLIPLLPLGPSAITPAEQASDSNLRFIAAEIIRERIIELTSDEIPHAVAVLIDRFREKSDITQIEATIYVERGSQKGNHHWQARRQ